MGFDETVPFAVLYAQCAVDDDERAWGELIRRFHPFVGKVVAGTFRVLSPEKWNTEDVEDAAQEAWYRLMRNQREHLRAYPDRSEGEFRVYLRTTAANVVRDRLKADRMQKRPRMARLDEETRDYLVGLAPDPSLAPDERIHRQLIAERVEPLLRRAWAGRPHLDRDITVCALYLMDGLSAQGISEIEGIGLSRGGVEKVVERGTKVLRQHFAGPGARSIHLDTTMDFDGEGQEPWRDLDEVLDFVLGALDRGTTIRRLHLLARDPEARGILRGVHLALGTPLEPELEQRLLSQDGVSLVRSIRSRARRESRTSMLPAWRRLELSRAFWATAAVLVVAIGPLLGRLPQPSLLPAVRDYGFEYPQFVATPMRLVQHFSPEVSGPSRGEESPVDEERMLQVEEQLIFERSQGADPVATSNALGHLKLARGQLSLAERNYLTALQHDPGNAEALIGIGVVNKLWADLSPDPEEQARYLDSADHALARVEPSSPLYLQALYDRIQVALAGDKLVQADSLLVRYQNLSPDDGWARALHAAVRKAGG